jgi:hypothetical protein
MERIRNLDAGEVPAADAVVETGEKPAAVHGPSRFRRRMVWGMAASVVLLAALGILFLGRSGTLSDEAFEEQIQVQLTALGDDQILGELDLSSVSEQELYEALGQQAQAALGEELEGVGQDKLLDYLDEMDLDAIDLQGLEIDAEFLNTQL